MKTYWLAVVIVVALTNPHYAQVVETDPAVESYSSTTGGVARDPLQEALSSLLSKNKAITSLALQVAADEKGYFDNVKQYTLKIKVMFQPDGKWYVRYDQFDKENRPIETLIVKDDKCDVLNYQSKSATRSQMNGNFVKADVDELTGICFPILPLLSDSKKHLDEHFSTSMVKADKDYTWIRFVPKTALKQRDVRVAQIGLINYKNSVSPANFPLHIAWIDPAGKQFTWRISQITRNDADLVRQSDFAIELREYERNGWIIQRNDGFALWKAYIGLFTKESEMPDWVIEKQKK